MKTFRYNPLTPLIYISCAVLLNLNCNQISQGDQRKKFEFLYKINNKSSLIGEYSNELTTYNELSFFEGRIVSLKEDILQLEVLKNWEKSSHIKQGLVRVLEDDLIDVSALVKQNLPPDTKIRNTMEVLKINKRIDYFEEELSKTIVEVGKE